MLTWTQKMPTIKGFLVHSGPRQTYMMCTILGSKSRQHCRKETAGVPLTQYAEGGPILLLTRLNKFNDGSTDWVRVLVVAMTDRAGEAGPRITVVIRIDCSSVICLAPRRDSVTSKGLSGHQAMGAVVCGLKIAHTEDGTAQSSEYSTGFVVIAVLLMWFWFVVPLWISPSDNIHLGLWYVLVCPRNQFCDRQAFDESATYTPIASSL
ncbi:hypothetical protein ScPMuIL_004873 [Solemya velum]